MSTSKIIPKDKVGPVERWQCPSVEHGAPPESITSVGPITAEAIEKIQKQAYKEAYNEGFTKGYKESVAKGKAEMEPQIELLKTALSALEDPISQMDQEVEQQLADLAIVIAKQLVRREIKTDPGQVIAVVREAVLALPNATEKVYVYLHPEDLVLVKSKLSPSDGEGHWRLTEDPALSRGDCKIMTASSTVDATVEKRLSALVAHLLGGERVQDNPQENPHDNLQNNLQNDSQDSRKKIP